MKIFQIGFNKTGTSSLHNLFKNYTNPKLQSVHWDNGLLAYSMLINKINNKPLLSGKYESYNFFSDMECVYTKDNIFHWLFIYMDDFKTLDVQYPNSKFILNIRDKTNWLKSRAVHRNNSPVSYIDSHKIYYKCKSYDDVIKIWSDQYDTHIKNVIDYFHGRSDDLLVFDIEKDPFQKFSNFFIQSNIQFTIDSLPHINKTP